MVTRLLQFTCFLLMIVWISVYLGGLRLSPKDTGEGANDTSQLFNWHPLLITLAFPLLMGEAILSYRPGVPLLSLEERYTKQHVSM
jgi:hypothetical protein